MSLDTIANVTESVQSWLLSDDHWVNRGSRKLYSFPVHPLAAKVLMLPPGSPSVSFLISELCMIFAPVVFYWLYSTFLYVLSHMNLTMVEIHRIPTNQPMRTPNKVTVRKVLYAVALQHIVQSITALVIVVITRPENVEDWKMESPLLVVVKLGVASVLLDTYQYWMHRWAHTNRTLYRMFHSVHHELTVPFAFGALYNHPVEGFVMDTIGSGVPSLLLNMHPWTSALFYSIATLKTVDDHCGYSWPWSPAALFNSNGAAYHDIHHWGKGRMYNFSQPFYTFWDHLMGTEYDSAMARKKLLREKLEALDGVKRESDSDETGSVSSVTASVTKEEQAAVNAVKSAKLTKFVAEESLRHRKVTATENDGSNQSRVNSLTRISARLLEQNIKGR
ncbi:hypothetical protein HDU81_007394 [Chytriomyces hyalinus]|nr:hypothetical protein HDU81_007394 [Chytriomyces hyalinus]